MSVVTPLLYEAAAREARPGVAPRLRDDALAALRDRVAREVGDLRVVSEPPAGMERFLRPVPFEGAVEQGLIGVPILDPHQFDVFVDGAEQGTSDSPRGERWWELWETDAGSWALFPGISSTEPRIALALPVIREDGTQLHVLDLGAPQDDGSDAAAQPSSSREPCVLDLEVREPGRSYKGICRDHGCTHACEKDLRLIPDRGRKELVGCDCPSKRAASRVRIEATFDTTTRGTWVR